MKKDLVIALILYAVVETAWLLGMRGFYASEFSRFCSTGKDLTIQSWPAVILVYALLLVAAVVFLRPVPSVALGALFGGVVYGVYNLTNKATLPGYGWGMVVVDTAWGASVFAAVAYVFKRFGSR